MIFITTKTTRIREVNFFGKEELQMAILFASNVVLGSATKIKLKVKCKTDWTTQKE